MLRSLLVAFFFLVGGAGGGALPSLGEKKKKGAQLPPGGGESAHASCGAPKARRIHGVERWEGKLPGTGGFRPDARALRGPIRQHSVAKITRQKFEF